MSGLPFVKIEESNLKSLRYKELFELRNEIAKFIGLDLTSMDGYGGDITWESVIPDANPLVFFLDSEDSLIEFSSTDTLMIAPEFEKFGKQLPKNHKLKEWVERAVEFMNKCALLEESFIMRESR